MGNPSHPYHQHSIPYLPQTPHPRTETVNQMGVFLFLHIFTFSTLVPYGVYHLLSSCRSHLLRPHYSARPFHPLPHPFHHHLLLTLPSLLLSSLLPLLFSTSPSSLLSSTSLLPFVLLSLSLPLLPPDLAFLLSSLSFSLISFSDSPHSTPPSLRSKLSSNSSLISASSALLSFSLAVNPRLYPAELALAASVSLKGLWSLHSGLSLYADAFVPRGCHRLLDVPEEDAAARCDLDESLRRAEALLDVAFVLYATLVAAVAVSVYGIVARAGGSNGVRRVGSYEALPTSASTGSLVEIGGVEHVQMKALGKSSAQA